jgi:hypothetical protein
MEDRRTGGQQLVKDKIKLYQSSLVAEHHHRNRLYPSGPPVLPVNIFFCLKQCLWAVGERPIGIYLATPMTPCAIRGPAFPEGCEDKSSAFA